MSRVFGVSLFGGREKKPAPWAVLLRKQIVREKKKSWSCLGGKKFHFHMKPHQELRIVRRSLRGATAFFVSSIWLMCVRVYHLENNKASPPCVTPIKPFSLQPRTRFLMFRCAVFFPRPCCCSPLLYFTPFLCYVTEKKVGGNTRVVCRFTPPAT